MASILDSIGSGLSTLGYVLDTPGALLRGTLAGRVGKRMSGRELLQSYGAVGNNRSGLDLGDVLGFGADLLVDPLNLIGGAGILGKASKASKAVKSNKASQALRAMGAMPAEIAAQTKLATAPGKPLRLLHGTASSIPFSQLDISPPGQAFLGRGVYFTQSPRVADIYSESNRAVVPPQLKDALVDKFVKIVNQHPSSKIKIEREEALDSFGEALRMDEMANDILSSPIAARAEREKERLLASGKRPPKGAFLFDTIDRFQNKMYRGHPRTEMRFADARNPYRFSDEATSDDILAIQSTMTPEMQDKLNVQLRLLESYKQGNPTKGEIWALARQLEKPDTIGEKIKNAGYDAIVHGDSEDVNIPALLRKAVSVPERLPLDYHDETMVFNPSQLYKPYIAPALQPVPKWKTQAGALALMNALRSGSSAGGN